MWKDTRFPYHFCCLLPLYIFWWGFARSGDFCYCNLRADFDTHFFLHTLVSYCAMHDTNLWRPLTIAIFGSFDQVCILTAHTLFSSFFPIYGCITLRLGTQSKSHVCLKIHRPLPVTSCLLICTNLSGTTQTWEMHTWHLICLHVQCPLNISTIVV